MTLPLAHSGHVLIDVAYVLPFAGLLIWLFATTIRERRRQEREAAEKGPDG
jgi:hypothetical protein